MKQGILLLASCLCALGTLQAQDPWNVVWRMTETPYLTLQDLDNVAMVKAGFDTDQDGWGEFIVTWTDEATNAILMYEATGDNTYALVWKWAYPVSAYSFAGIAVGDLDKNGKPEIITCLPSVPGGTTPSPNRLWVFEWNGVQGENKYGGESGGEVIPSSAWNFDLPDNTDFRPYSLVVEDIDKDGTNELIVGVRTSARPASGGREIFVVSVTGELSGFHTWNTEYNLQSVFGGALYSVTTGDLDNDGNREIHALIWDLFTMRILECTGEGAYTQAFAVDKLYQSAGIDYGAVDGVVVTDVNGDQMNEMYIAGTEDPNKIFVVTGVTDLSQLSAASIKELFTIPPIIDGGFRSMQVADPDKDGRLNLMIAGERDGRIYSLEYNGTGDPADSASWTSHVLYDVWSYSSIAPATTLTPRFFYGSPARDMDKDGKDEYVFINYSPDFTAWAQESPLWVIEIDLATSVHEGSSAVPSTAVLYQNYPNPFNPSTTIPFALAERSRVRLEIFDMFGQRVAALIDGIRDAGHHSVVWNADLPSGVYFSTLEAAGLDRSSAPARLTRRMILVR